MEDLMLQGRIAEIISHSFPDFDLISYDLNEGENKAQFLSIINIITTRLRSKVDSSEQELQIFLKSIPRNPIKHQMALESKHFKREILMYNVVLPLLCNQRGFSSYPKVYYATSNDSSDFLAMENLTLEGFATTDRLSGLDSNHLSITIKTVAELHGCSFSVFKDGKETLKQFPELVDAFFRGTTENEFREMGKLCLSNTPVDIRKVLKDEGRVDLIPKLDYYLGQYAQENILGLVKIPTKFPSVITHGDLWTSNLMFRYSKEGDSKCPVDMKLLDFQASLIGSRILDLAYLIFTSASLSVLQTEESIQPILRLYFETFSKTCQRFNCQLQFTSQELSWDHFLEEWEIYKHFGLIKAVLLAFIMYSPPDDIPNCEEMVESDMVKNTVEDKGNKPSSIFDNLWKHKLMRVRLIHLIQNFLPNVPPDSHTK